MTDTTDSPARSASRAHANPLGARARIRDFSGLSNVMPPAEECLGTPDLPPGIAGWQQGRTNNMTETTTADPWAVDPDTGRRRAEDDHRRAEDDRRCSFWHYASQPVTEYTQFDLIPDMPGGDGLAAADDDGDILYSTTSAELWHGFPCPGPRQARGERGGRGAAAAQGG